MHVLKAPFVILLSLLLLGGWALSHPPAAAAQDGMEPTETPTVVFPVPSAVTNNTRVRIGGSPTMNPINQALKRQFEEQFPGTAVDLEGDLSDTERALEALKNGDIDLAAMGRSLTPDEKAAGLREVPVSFDKIAILTGKSNPFNGSLTIEQLGQIFRGEITDWAELGRSPGRIEIIDRPASSETRQALQRYGIIPPDEVEEPEPEAAATENESGEDAELADGEVSSPSEAIPVTPAEVASLKAMVRSLPTDETEAVVKALGRNGLGYAIANQVRNESSVKWIKIAIIRTTLPGDALYPYSQMRGYAYRDESNSRVQSFLGFTSTEAGRAAIAAARTAEANVKPPPEPVVSEEPVEKPVAIAPVESPGTGFDLSQIPTWAWFLIPVFPIVIPIYLVWRRRQARARRVTRPVPPRSPRPSARKPKPTATIVDTSDTTDTDTDLDEFDDWDDNITEAPTTTTAPDVPKVMDAEFEEYWEGDRATEPDVATAENAIPSADLPVAPDVAEPPAVEEEAIGEEAIGEEAIAKATTEAESDLDARIDAALEDAPTDEIRATEPDVAWAEETVPSTPLPTAPELHTEPSEAETETETEAETELPEAPEPSEAAAVPTEAAAPPEPKADEEPEEPVVEEGVYGEVVPPVVAPLEPTLPAETSGEPEAEPEAETIPPESDTEEQPEELVYGEVVPVINPPDTMAPPEEEAEPSPEADVEDLAAESVLDETVLDETDGEPTEEAIALSPEPTSAVPYPPNAAEPASAYAQGLMLLEARQFEEALRYFEQATAERNVEEQLNLAEIADIWESKGRALLGLGRSLDALAAFEQGLALDENVAALWSGKGDALTHLGRDQEALACYGRAAELRDAPRGMTLPAEDVPPALQEQLPTDAAPPSTEPTLMPTVENLPAEVWAEPVPLPEGGELTGEWLKYAIVQHLARYGKTVETATPNEFYFALARNICQVLLERRTPEDLLTADPALRLVAELAAEYAPGPHLKNALINLGALETAQETLQGMGQDLTTLMTQEEEPGLGRGGLGQLMVSYLDSLATQRLPAIGYGLRYEYGIFDQEIRDGWQVEVPDNWLIYGNPWEVERGDRTVTVSFGGYTEAYSDEQGRYRVRWNAAQSVQGQCFDTPLPGYQNDTVSLLRLWRANTDDPLGKVLYPVNAPPVLRLKQQYFLVSCTLQDLLRLHLQRETTLDTLPDHLALQLNDTDTLLAIAELMRLLVDEHGLEWDIAWDLTNHTLSYTNHSLLPETLDDHWGIDLFATYLPRHLEIIYEINQRFLDGVRSQYFVETDQIRRLSLVDDDHQRIRLTHLACIGTHAVNGVSPLHSQRLQDKLVWDFYALTPDRFLNASNGINIRRFLLVANTPLADLITQHIGDSWIEDARELARLEPLATETDFCHKWHAVKQAAKERLALLVRDRLGEPVDPHSLFDGQLTLIHEYKRQLLNLLHVITLYQRIKAHPDQAVQPRTVLFSGKASPDYDIAKRIIKLIHQVSATVNADPDVGDRLKVLFLPDFTLKLAERVYPALELSEHLSQAGTEAGDIGNMIAALNGALLIATPDGSNLELRETLGEDAVFQFGLTVEEVEYQRQRGYRPQAICEENPALQQAVQALIDGSFGDTGAIAHPIVHSLLSTDPYGVLADYAAYIATQDEVSRRYENHAAWTTHSILAVARMGRFSSDRAIQHYNQDIWNATPAAKRLRQRIKPPGG